MWMQLLLLMSIVYRLTDAGYCTAAYSCNKQCRTSTKYYESCGFMGWDSCSKRRTAYKYCPGTCYKRKCCDGYTGTYCETPICFDSTSCPNGGICTLPDTCECIVGFSEPSCADINECETTTHGCQHGCENTHGSYQCTCKDGYFLDSDRISCIDVNECMYDNGGCSTNCENTAGSFNCTCKVGFFLDDDGISCNDEDECQLGTSDCTDMCTNTLGSYQCSCHEGFFLYGHTCYDIDECADGTATCETYCVNTVGSYTCACNTGYAIDESNICREIDECFENSTVCDQICVNVPGSYYCECADGYQLNGSSECIDIDECSVGIAGCSDYCINNQGSFSCSCTSGFDLSENERTCEEINECIDVVCQNGGICSDGLNTFTCLCTSGYTNTYCESDINECATFNGGCQDNCTNMKGSFKCSCSEERILQEDGHSCKGGDDYKSVFEKYNMPRQLLPKPCFEVLLTHCTEGRDVEIKLASTAEWYTSPTDQSVFYTLGISFIKLNSFFLPVSLQGIEVSLHGNFFELRYSATSSEGILKKSNLTTPGCEAFAFKESDMYDFISADSFSKTLLWSLYPQLPRWLRFERVDQSVIAVQDMKSDLIYGRDMDTIVECTGAPVIASHLYSVFRFGTGFYLKILGDEIEFPSLLEARKFCIIVDICTDAGGSIFLMIPEESRDLLLNLTVFQSLYNASYLLIKPRGIGLSFVDGIHVDQSPMTLWNGDTMFQNPEMHFADLWIGGDLELDQEMLTVEGSADIYFNIPSVERILSSVFRDEWNGIIDVSAEFIFKFTLFDQEFAIKFLRADVDVYLSAGGSNRNWCGENSNPAGLYFSLLLELNPFLDVPLLEDWVFKNTHRLYAFISKDSRQSSASVQHLSDKIYQISNLVNSTLAIVTASGTDLANISNDTFQSITDDLVLIQYIIHIDLNNGWINVDIDHIIPAIEKLMGLSRNLKHTLEQLIYEVEFIANTTAEALVDSLNAAIEQIQSDITYMFNSITNSIMKEFGEFRHFGLKYTTDIVLLGLKFPSIDFEIVFSDGNLFECSRFDKIAELLKDKNAIRLVGRYSFGVPLGFFLHVEPGMGLGGAIAMHSDLWILQFELFAVMFGIRETVDVFITSEGSLYFYSELNVWDTFLAQMDVSAEIGKEWYELTYVVEGRFVANARQKRQIQTRSDTFQDSYIDGLKKVVSMKSNDAQKRLAGVQNGLSKAQNGFTKAQNWLEEKKDDLRKANQLFDNAISSLENAKQSVEKARVPFQNAVKALHAAEKTVDDLCKIRSCPKICIPGIRCKTCHKKVWGGRISYPCCGFVHCMISFPEPFCLLANAVCRALRAIAFGALEAAVAVLRISMVTFDIAQASLTVAQTVVDTSRVSLKVAEGILLIAQAGLEFAKGILEAAKIALETVKLVVGAAAKVLDLVLEFGLKSLLDVRNCGFKVEMSTTDLPVFDVSCEVNALRLGWKPVRITINFKNIEQSIWQAARATINELMKTFENGFGRRKRDVEFKSTSKLHRLLRIIRQTDEDEALSLNETIDITKQSNTLYNISDDYDAADRVLAYQEKCKTIETLQDFLQSTFKALNETLYDSMAYTVNVNSVKDELLQFNATETIADNITAEDIGIRMEYAAKYNMTHDDIENAVEGSKSGFNDDPIILEIKNAANISLKNVELETKSIESIDFVNIWYTAMDNLTTDYFSEAECIGFRDCMFYTISSFYTLYEAEYFPYASDVRTSILDLESIVIESFQNETLSITDTANSFEFIVNTIDKIIEMNPFCSEAPTINKHPNNLTILLGTDATFYCSAVGNPEPLYSWYKNDILVPGELEDTITVKNVTEDDHGTKFNCVAGNIVANITSMNAFLLTAQNDVDECETDNGDCEHGCLNNVGSYECTCPDGYMINEADGHSCLDTDECQATFTGVRCEHVCNNFIGGYNCSCYEGYNLNNDAHSCYDIDECQIENGGCDYQCLNNDGSFKCICNEGYTGRGSIGQCIDTNECETNNGECEQICTNTDGSFFCACLTGYMLDTDGHHCTDIDECDEDNAGCEHICVNTEGTYHCACAPGYMLEEDFHQCSDIDECENNNGDCEHQCVNTFGSYLCCDGGFEFDTYAMDCIDIDECSVNNGNCSHTCINEPSSFTCVCNEGYDLSQDGFLCVDSNECDATRSVCEQDCINTEGSFTCSCVDGFVMAIDERHCVDIDECSEENGGCEYECTNAPGTHVCSCALGYILDYDGFSCSDFKECNEDNGGCEHKCNNNVGSFTCTCNEGYALADDGLTCDDMDECSKDNGGCAQHCINNIGSFTCTCNEGFVLAGDGFACNDVDECSEDNVECVQNCFNSDGSYTCACNDGFVLDVDGFTCNDVDECSQYNVQCTQNCINSIGSFTCACNDGFVLDGDGFTCNDVNECSQDNVECAHNCINTIGSFSCACDEGFVLADDSLKCNDVDECSKDKNGCAQNCINTIGSFNCACYEGFVLADDSLACNDVDECSKDNNGCAQNCINTIGSFTCACNDGFVLDGDGYACNDVDECSQDNVECAQNCINTIGSFTCACNDGFVLGGDGFTCNDVDECHKDESNGGCSHRCENVVGSFRCLCDAGYSLSDDKLRCEDIDECKLNNGGCNQKCVNTNGSFHCDCKQGFKLHKHVDVCIGSGQRAMKTSVTMEIVPNPSTRKKRSMDFNSNDIQLSLDEFYNKYTSQDVETYVQSVRTLNNKMGVNYTVVYDESDAPVLAIATIHLSSGTQLNYKGTLIASRSYLPENVTNECHVFETLMDGCGEGERCEITSDGPSCLTDEKDPPGLNSPMVILPVSGALILCVIVACIVFFVLRVRKQRTERIKRKRTGLQRQSDVIPRSSRAMITRVKHSKYEYGGSPYKY